MRLSPSVPRRPAHLNDARRLLIASALGLFGALAFAGAASATPAAYTVNDTTDAALSNSAGTACVSTHGGSCTLRAAVQAADNTGGVSTITLPAGDFKLEIPSTVDDEPANGDLDVKGATTAITLTGAGASSTTIDANHIDRAFAVQSGESLTVSGVTVRNGAQPDAGSSDESSDPGFAGAFLNYGSLTVEHSLLIGNSAVTGGGVVSSPSGASSTSIIDSTVEHNSSDGEGGVLYALAGNVTLTGDTIEHNTSEAAGGALYYYKTGTAGAVTVTDSTISNNTGGDDGGALDVFEASSLAVKDSTLDSNGTDDEYAGAIYAEKLGSVTIEGSTLSNNSTGDEYGGAVYIAYDGTLTVSSSTFDGNNSGNSDGGAIYVYETNLEMSGSSFRGNEGAEGGALYIEGATNTAVESITTSTFANNKGADEYGGAIYDDKGNLQIYSSTFSANSAYYGGALYYDSADGLGLGNDTFDGNQAGGEGGAIDIEKVATTGSIDLLNDTVTRNQSYRGGGIFKPQNANAIENTIVAGNYGGFSADGGGDCWGTKELDNAATADKGGNIDGDGSCFSGETPGDQVNVAPLLGELAANGGPTETDGLLAGSPAIGTGVSSPFPCPPVDQRGAARSGACDVGAFQGVLGGSSTPSGSTTVSGSSAAAATTVAAAKAGTTKPAPCKSKRTERINWKARAGVHFQKIVVMRGGKTYRHLAGSAREATVSLVGLPKGAVVVRVTGTTHSGEQYTMARTYHLCAAHRRNGKSGSGYLTHS